MYQKDIFISGSKSSHFLEYQVPADVDPGELRTRLRAIDSRRSPEEGIHLVMSFGSDLWEKLSPDTQIEGLRPFTGINGVLGLTAPATQCDLFLWIHSSDRSDAFDLATAAHDLLAPLAELQLEVDGFHYHESRDLTGFEDGTGNPKDEAQQGAALIPAGQPGEGGSFVLAQKWVHNLSAFNEEAETDQEKIIGRTKKESIELTGDEMPENSHVSRTDVKIDGEAMKIFRRSFPYGSMTERGLLFLGFSCDLFRFDIQLRRMYGLTDDGIHDKLIEFSKAISGSYTFAPSRADLNTILETPK